MNVIDRKIGVLEKILIKNNISVSKYTLEIGSMYNQKFGIDRNDHIWSTYYFEENNKKNIETFFVFDLAVQNFLKKITDDNLGTKLFIEYRSEIKKINYLIYQDEIETSKRLLETLKNEKEIEYHKANIKLNEKFLKNLNKKTNEDFILPEWREDGYFNSSEFKKIEEEVELIIDKIGIPESTERDILKQKILKEEYNINWVTIEHRFTKDSNVIID